MDDRAPAARARRSSGLPDVQAPLSGELLTATDGGLRFPVELIANEGVRRLFERLGVELVAGDEQLIAEVRETQRLYRESQANQEALNSRRVRRMRAELRERDS